MSKLPTRRNEVPAKPNKGSGTPRSFEETAAAMRRATGKAETRTLYGCCAEAGGKFIVTFERVSPAHRYQIVSIEKEPEPTGGRKGGLFAAAGRFAAKVLPMQEFAWSEFDQSGWACPYCGDSQRIMCPDCGYIVCGARKRTLPNGRESYACHDACGASGTLVSTDRVRGAAGGGSSSLEMKAGKKAAKALPGGQKKLPAPARGLLPWNRK